MNFFLPRLEIACFRSDARRLKLVLSGSRPVATRALCSATAHTIALRSITWHRILHFTALDQVPRERDPVMLTRRGLRERQRKER